MNPDFLKKLAEITAALRSGLTANPLDELQKRATQFGEGVGYGLEHDRAQASYARAHPESARAQQERYRNAAMMALQLGHGEKPILIPAIKTLDGRIVDGITHAHAYMDAGITEPLPPKFEGYTDPSTKKFYTRQAAEKLMKAWMSPSVKAQIAERSRQAGKDMGMTTEDLNGKLYANRGTKADPPMTLDDLNRIMAKKNKGKASLDSAVVLPLSTLLSRVQARRENIAQNWGKNRRPFEDRVADQNTIAANAAAYKARMHPEDVPAPAPAMSPEEARISANAAAYKARKGALGSIAPAPAQADPTNSGRKSITPERLAQFNRNLGNPPFEDPLKLMTDSVVSKLPAALQGKGFKNDVDKRIRGALFENALRAEKAAREAERASAAKANARDYGITKDDRAALKRGDIQRKTGVPMDSVVSLGSRLHEALTKNGGFTIDPETGADLTSGYSVGGGEKSGVLLKKPLADLKPNELESFLAANKNKLRPGQAWGGWVDNGQVYAEPADQVSDINEAQRLGNERGEKAIWDHANKAEIPLKAGRAEAASTKVDDFNSILGKWHTTLAGYRDLGKQLAEAPERHRAALLDAEQNPVTPSTPWLTKYTQQDIERPNGASPEKIGRVESMAYDAFTSPKFKKWLEAGHGTGNWYDTRKTQARAIVALGDKLGPQAFNEFIDHVAASTAMSRPENNIRRASWYRALNLQGMLNPDELRSSTLAAPEGMGHLANKAHHYATADLVQNGEVNKLANPKPASFGENLKMNWRPLTFDTRMANATLTAKPKMTLGLAGEKSDATPRKWAYAPIERAAQQAAAEAAKRGDLGDLPAGVDPTAAWQAQVWGGIGRTSKSHMMSVNNPSFHEILDRLLKRSAERWGVTPGKANELFWKGQPLDLPLDAKLVTGPSRVRKK